MQILRQVRATFLLIMLVISYLGWKMENAVLTKPSLNKWRRKCRLNIELWFLSESFHFRNNFNFEQFLLSLVVYVTLEMFWHVFSVPHCVDGWGVGSAVLQLLVIHSSNIDDHCEPWEDIFQLYSCIVGLLLVSNAGGGPVLLHLFSNKFWLHSHHRHKHGPHASKSAQTLSYILHSFLIASSCSVILWARAVITDCWGCLQRWLEWVDCLDSSAGITLFVIALHHQRPQLISNICMFSVVLSASSGSQGGCACVWLKLGPGKMTWNSYHHGSRTQVTIKATKCVKTCASSVFKVELWGHRVNQLPTASCRMKLAQELKVNLHWHQ